MAVIDRSAAEYVQQRDPSIVDKKLKSLFITLPQRDLPGPDIPYGPMAVMTYLKKNGYPNTFLYHLDMLRPTRQEAIDYIVESNPDVLCISAPVSTSYENCLFYSTEVRKRLPNIRIVLGGNMAASADILLYKTEVDVCVTGEGETPALKMFDKISQGKWKEDFYDIQGLAFLDENNKFINTGDAEQLPVEKVFDVDWDILDENTIKHCFRRIGDVERDSISWKYLTGPEGGELSEEDLNKTIGQMALSKGCVARCTFCHRFQKGIRYVPVDICIERIKEAQRKLNVGAFSFGDECFGSDLRWLDEFLTKVKPLNINWQVAGMRVKQITTELVERMKEAGCKSIIYGMETGSERMIQIMEKRASVEDNKRAFKITLDAGLYTIPQLIIGMPGETFETIKESAEFLCDNLTIHPYQNPREVSINHAQALPGTPLYEYARHKGLIGKTLEDEEKYLYEISDRNAADEETTLNFTDYPQIMRISWVGLIKSIVNYRYYKKWGSEHYFKVLFDGKKPSLFSIIKENKMRGFMIITERYPRLFYHSRHFMWLLKLMHVYIKFGFKYGWNATKELIVWAFKRPFQKEKSIKEYKSLRTIVEKELPGALKGLDGMVPLRKGR